MRCKAPNIAQIIEEHLKVSNNDYKMLERIHCRLWKKGELKHKLHSVQKDDDNEVNEAVSSSPVKSNLKK